MKTFSNVFEPAFKEISSGNYTLKGKWNSEIFKNENEIVLELGCGKGEYTLGLAEKYPEKNFIGIDIKGARMWRGAKTALEKKLRNVIFIRTRIEFLDSFFAPDEISEIWLTFPDPQPQKPRERKRLTSMRFLNIYKKILSQNGCIHLKTDSKFLFDYSLEIINENNIILLEFTDDLYGNSNEEKFSEAKSIQTFYEKKFLKEEKKICYLKFKFNENFGKE